MEPHWEMGPGVIEGINQAVARKDVTQVSELLSSASTDDFEQTSPFILVTDKKFGQQVFDLATSQYQEVSGDKKIVLTKVLDDLGARCEVFEDKTTHFLIDNFDKTEKETQPAIIVALKNKLNRATLNLAIHQKLSVDQEERARLILQKLTSILMSDSTDGIKASVIRNIGGILNRGFDCSTLTTELKKYLQNESNLSSQAFDELSVLADPQDETMRVKLKEKVGSFDFNNQSYREKLKLINQIKKFNDGSYGNILEVLSQDPHPLVNQSAQEFLGQEMAGK